MAESKKRKVSHKGARQKGFRAEAEVCSILTELGVPTQRVLASGALKGAEGDLKVGVKLLPNGEFPEKDEGMAIMRGECKNRATNIDRPYEDLKHIVAMLAPKDSPELPYKDLAQSPATKVLFWKRAKTPQGTISNKNYNEAYLAIMGIKDFAGLLKELQDLREEVEQLRGTVRILSTARND